MMNIIDPITKFFDCQASATCELNTDTPRLEMINPLDPLNGRNVEWRSNWKILAVDGLDPLADVELTTEQSRFRSGAIIKGRRRREKTIFLSVQICPCDDCDIYTQRKELYDIIDCQSCGDNCLQCCSDGTICLTDYAVRDARYCIMRSRCCDVIRDIGVVRTGQATITRQGACEVHTFEFLAPNPDLYHPRLQSETMFVSRGDLICPEFVCGDVNLRLINSFETCVTINYSGSVTGYPKFTIVGDVTNLVITNTNTGASIDLNNREDQFTLSGCGATILNFWRGQQLYRDNKLNNIYADLRRACNNEFFFEPNCGEIELCFTGDFVDIFNFRVRIDWWNEHDGFFASGADDGSDIYRCEDYDNVAC